MILDLLPSATGRWCEAVAILATGPSLGLDHFSFNLRFPSGPQLSFSSFFPSFFLFLQV
jgi:hypothetical protein